MKSFNEFTNLQKLIESSSKQELLILLESSSEALKNYIRNALETIDDVDRLKEIYKGIAGPVVRQKARDLFAARGMSDSKGIAAADQLAQVLNDKTAVAQFKTKLLDELIKGEAIDIQGIITDAASKLTFMTSSSYIKGKSPLWKDNSFYNWFWNWEPPMGGRAVGGGEMAMILSVPGGKKGGEGGVGGDVALPGQIIEMKKAVGEGKGGGAGFGSSNNFDNAKRTYLNFVNNTQGLPDEIKEQAEAFGFGGPKSSSLFKGQITNVTDPAHRFSATMNAITIPLVAAGRSLVEIGDMWDDVCIACQGKSPSFSFKRFAPVIMKSDGYTNVNLWMHVWVANGIDAYKEKEGHDIIFLYDPGNLSAVAYKDGSQFLRAQYRGSGSISYDWAVSWTNKEGMGYGNYVPRLKVKPYQNVQGVRGVDGIKDLTQNYIAHGLFYEYLSDPLNAKSPRINKTLIKIGEVIGIRNIASDMKTKPVDVIKQLVAYYDTAVKNTNAAGMNPSRIKTIKSGLADLIIWANNQ